MASENQTPTQLGWPIRLLIVYAILATAAGTLVATNLQDDNLKLLRAIGQRDSLIASIQQKDQLYDSTTKAYSEVITRYISDCNILVDGKKVSNKQLINLFNQLINENDTLRDSLIYYKRQSIVGQLQSTKLQLRIHSLLDTINIKSKIVELVNRDYGITYNVDTYDRGFTFSRNLSRADSAMVLFPFYKDRIKRDTAKGNWIITTEKTTIIQPSANEKWKRKNKKH
jgi:hypothetical protein